MFNGIKDIQAGKMDDIIVLIKSISTLKMKSGEPYQKVVVRDQDGREATFIQFDAMLSLQPPAVVRARVECVKYGANVSVKIRKCTETGEYGIGAFLPKPHIEVKKSWSYIVKTVKSIKPGLGRIVCSIISENKDKFLTLPLNPAGAFARQSGILEATTKLMALAEVAAKQQNLDRDLLMAAAILYYSGHMDTVDAGYNNTVTDLMYGAAACACHKVQIKSVALAVSDGVKSEISDEDVMMLGHILTVKGNIVAPAIPEAATLKYFDRMLQEIDEMNETLANAEDAVSIDPNHFDRRLYKAHGKR